uniref:Uncharacterized protein n=1 Tax=viral metagenome TaxID=1070528 RepID=A0A6M3INW0_9ZZZZ
MNIITKIKLTYSFYLLYQLWEKLPMKEFFASKKALALTLGVITTVLINVVGLPEADAAKVTEAIQILFGAYFIGQGIADVGKGKAQANGGQK